MTEIDKIEIKQLLNDALIPLQEKLDTVCQENRSVYQSIFGISGTNGIANEVKILKNEIEQLKIFKTRVVTIFAAIQAALIFIVQIMIYWIKSKLGG